MQLCKINIPLVAVYKHRMAIGQDLTDKGLSVERLYRGTSKQREAVGKIMETIVMFQYPLEAESITFDDLLEWELWPSFIKIFSESMILCP